MTDSERSLRVYSDAEVGKILKRATELQETRPQLRAERAGLSLTDLEEIAREVGIDAEHLRRAARELDTQVPGTGTMEEIVGGPLALVRERTVRGEIGDEGFEALVLALQHNSGSGVGQPSLLGRTLHWTSRTPTETRTLHVSVSSRDGKTRIRIEERLHQLAGGLFGGVVAGAGLGVGLGVGLPLGINALGSVLFSVAFPLGSLAVAYLASRSIYRQISSNRSRFIDGLLDELTDVVEMNVRDALPPRGPSESQDSLTPGDSPG